MTSGQGHVGPVIFANETARAQLLRGEVISFRAGDPRTTGETWARWSRTGEKQADVTIEHLTAIDPLREDDWHDPLDHYWGLSGFASPDAWRAPIRDYHGDDVDGRLYLVTLRPLEILDRLASDQFDGAAAIEADVKPSAYQVARVADAARPGVPEDLEPRHVLDVMEASGGRIAVYCEDSTDGKHWLRYRPWDDQYETYDRGPGVNHHDVVPRYAPHAWLDDHILTEAARTVEFVRPSSTRHWDWTWAKRLVVAADQDGEVMA